MQDAVRCRLGVFSVVVFLIWGYVGFESGCIIRGYMKAYR